MVQAIKPQLLREWQKEGEILTIWRCNRCFRKVPLYKTDNPIVNSIYLAFANFEKYCDKCKKKLNPTIVLKRNVRREIILLKKYENIIVEEKEEF